MEKSDYEQDPRKRNHNEVRVALHGPWRGHSCPRIRGPLFLRHGNPEVALGVYRPQAQFSDRRRGGDTLVPAFSRDETSYRFPWDQGEGILTIRTRQSLNDRIPLDVLPRAAELA